MMKKHLNCHIAYFVSPHGFGHASRSAAVMEAITTIDPSVHFEIFTTVPEWFFKQSLTQPFDYHPVLTDIGFAQNTPMLGDLEATLQALEQFLPFNRKLLSCLSEQLKSLNCRLVVSDISPLGIVVAKEAGLPSLLVENFTWNWMYDGLGPRFDKHKDYLGRIYEQAAYHIQTEPICQHQQGNLTVGPISRSPRHDREYTRKKLGVSDTAHLILVAMGGIEDRYDPLTSISIPPGCSIIFPGASSKVEKHGNLILLPHASEFFHPDLIHACDAVIGKAGYSTIAEIFAAGIPYGYILRKDSRESAILQQFIRRHISGFEIEESDFRSGNWVDYLDNLLALPAVKHPIPNSADRVARNVLNVIDGGKQ